jgi:excisionase family DNA binding protein
MQTQSQTLDEPLSYSIPDAARRAGLSSSNVRLRIQNGELKARQMGRRVLILDADLRAWLEALPSAKRGA